MSFVSFFLNGVDDKKEDAANEAEEEHIYRKHTNINTDPKSNM